MAFEFRRCGPVRATQRALAARVRSFGRSTRSVPLETSQNVGDHPREVLGDAYEQFVG